MSKKDDIQIVSKVSKNGAIEIISIRINMDSY